MLIHRSAAWACARCGGACSRAAAAGGGWQVASGGVWWGNGGGNDGGVLLVLVFVARLLPVAVQRTLTAYGVLHLHRKIHCRRTDRQ
jgi:uncharacterized membrane protein